MRILTLRWVFVRRLSHPRDSFIWMCVQSYFRTESSGWTKNQFKFNALRRESPIASWGSTSHAERWRCSQAIVSGSEHICWIDVIHPLYFCIRSGTTFPFRCSYSLSEEHGVRCFELGMYTRVGWLGSPSKCNIFWVFRHSMSVGRCLCGDLRVCMLPFRFSPDPVGSLPIGGEFSLFRVFLVSPEDEVANFEFSFYHFLAVTSGYFLFHCCFS